MPEKVQAVVERGSWPSQPIFSPPPPTHGWPSTRRRWIHTFNNGLGYGRDWQRARMRIAFMTLLRRRKCAAYVIGEVQPRAALGDPEIDALDGYLCIGRELGRVGRHVDGGIPVAKVELYTTTFCPYCVRAKSLLKSKGRVPFVEIDVNDDAELRQKNGRNVGWPAAPFPRFSSTAKSSADTTN